MSEQTSTILITGSGPVSAEAIDGLEGRKLDITDEADPAASGQPSPVGAQP
jgi:hypothetical protein